MSVLPKQAILGSVAWTTVFVAWFSINLEAADCCDAPCCAAPRGHGVPCQPGAAPGDVGSAPFDSSAPGIGDADSAPGDQAFNPRIGAQDTVTPDGQFGRLAADVGASGGGGSSFAGANLMGDFFGSGQFIQTTGVGVQGHPAAVPIAAGDRRFKMGEDFNPFPQDRVFFNYSHFHHAVLTVNGVNTNVERYVFGVEKTFYDGFISTEIRIPLADGLAATEQLGGADNGAVEFGNLSLSVKALLLEEADGALAAGLRIGFPTAANGQVVGILGPGSTLDIENQSIFLQPFLGLSWTPDDDIFCHLVAAFDFDATGNDVFVNGVFQGNSRGQDLAFLDFAIGRWICCDPCRCWVQRIAPAFELHYTGTVSRNGLDSAGTQSNVGIGSRSLNILNAVAGVHFEITSLSTLTVSTGAPIVRADEAKPFTHDFELGIQFNRRF